MFMRLPMHSFLHVVVAGCLVFVDCRSCHAFVQQGSRGLLVPAGQARQGSPDSHGRAALARGGGAVGVRGKEGLVNGAGRRSSSSRGNRRGGRSSSHGSTRLAASRGEDGVFSNLGRRRGKSREGVAAVAAAAAISGSGAVTCGRRRPYGDRSRGSSSGLFGASSKGLLVDDDGFPAAVLENEKPVLVLFSAAWCGPCRMVGPVLDEIQADYPEKLAVVELSTDDNREVVSEFGVRAIPTIMLFTKGKSVMTVVGAVPKTSLLNSIKQHIDLT